MRDIGAVIFSRVSSIPKRNVSSCVELHDVVTIVVILEQAVRGELFA